MSTNYKIVFRGDIAPGHSMPEVRDRLQELFKLGDETVGKLFSGRPVAIKKGLDENTANKWCELLLQAGAIADAVADESSPPAPPPGGESADNAEPEAESYGLEVSPVGADVLKPSERKADVEREVPVADLTVDEVGADVLRDGERREFVELELDLSHLRLEDIPLQ